MRGYKESMEIIIDNIALWRPKMSDTFTVRTHAIGTPYKTRDNAYEKAKKPLYRYAKSYTVADGKAELGFSLFVRTLNSDAKAVERQLDAAAQKVTPAQVREVITNPVESAFSYLNIYLEK